MRDVSSWPLPEQLKYFAARFAYRHRWDVCERYAEIDGEYVEVTYATWFRLRFGISLDQYHAQLLENSDATEQATGEGGQSDPLAG